MCLEYVHKELAKLQIPFSRPLESLLARVLQQKILQVLIVFDPLRKFPKVDGVTAVLVNRLESQVRKIRNAVLTGDRESD